MSNPQDDDLHDIPSVGPEKIRLVIGWVGAPVPELSRVAGPVAAAFERQVFRGTPPQRVSFAALVDIVNDELGIDDEEREAVDELAEMADDLVTPDAEEAPQFTCADLVAGSIEWMRDAVRRLDTEDHEWAARAALPVEDGARAIIANVVAIGWWAGIAQLVARLRSQSACTRFRSAGECPSDRHEQDTLGRIFSADHIPVRVDTVQMRA